MEGDRISSTERYHLKAMPSGSEPVLKQVSLLGDLLTPMPNMALHALGHGLKVLFDVSVVENSCSVAFERVKEEQNRLQEKRIVRGMDNVKLKKKMLDRNVAMRAMPQCLVNLQATVKCLQTEKSLLMMKNKVLVYRSSQKNSRGGQVTKTLLKHIPPVYWELQFKVQEAILRYWSREI